MHRIRAALAAALLMTPTLAQDIDVKTDVVYVTRPDGDLKLDIVAPKEGAGPFPAVICIHGGAWRAGDKSSNRPFMEALARHGYVAVAPQYRFCPKHPFPAQVHDVKEAVRWVRAHAKDLRVDPERLGATGASAGGHLAMMLGVTGPEDGLEGENIPTDAPPTGVKAVVNLFGPTDLGALDVPEVTKPLLRDFLGGTPLEKAEACAQASPLTHLTKGDAPILTFQGTRDPLVPHSQAFVLTDHMTRHGIPGRVELLVNAGHGWGGPEMQRTFERSIQFFDEHLK